MDSQGLNSPASELFVFYRYHPNEIAAWIFAFCFHCMTVAHVFQAASKRTWYLIPMIFGGLCELLFSLQAPRISSCHYILQFSLINTLVEVVGFVSRVLAHYNETDVAIYIVQSLLLLVAPALLAASIYMILGHLIVSTRGEALSPISTRWLTKIFVLGDVLSFLVQAVGTYYLCTYYLTMNESYVSAGQTLIG